MPDSNCYVCLSDGVNYWVGPIRNIVYLEQGGNYCTFTIGNGKKLNIRGSLHQFETKLPDSLFFRTSRECIINMSYVKQMQAYDAKRYSMTMEDDKEIVLSRKQSVLFRKTKSL